MDKDKQSFDTYEALINGYASGKRDFRLANLEGTNFDHSNLESADFYRGNFHKCRFRDASLIAADFQSADLSSAEFVDTDVTDTSFINSDLSAATLIGAKGLLPAALQGANLRGASLPPEFSLESVVSGTEELTSMCRKIYLTTLATYLYSLLAIGSTTDANLVLGYGSLLLPIIDTTVPLETFYYVAPLLILGVFVYFHMNLQRLFEKVAKLPSVLPDGKSSVELVPPWLILPETSESSRDLNSGRRTVYWLHQFSALILVWWAGPLVIGLMWWRTLVAVDLWLSYFQAICFIISCFLAVQFRSIALARISEKGEGGLPWKRYVAFVVAVVAPVLLISEYYIPTSQIHVQPEADFRGMNLAYKTLRNAHLSLARFDQADLHGADLDGTVMRAATLTRADLEQASFVKADLRDAIIERTNLPSAVLEGTLLSNASLARANLSGARMQRAYLINSQMKQAMLIGSVLTKAILIYADLEEADLTCAILDKANLSNANLKGADLSGTNLTGAHMKGVDLTEAIFRETILTGTDLSRVSGLTEEMFASACGKGTVAINNTTKWELRKCKDSCR